MYAIKAIKLIALAVIELDRVEEDSNLLISNALKSNNIQARETSILIKLRKQLNSKSELRRILYNEEISFFLCDIILIDEIKLKGSLILLKFKYFIQFPYTWLLDISKVFHVSSNQNQIWNRTEPLVGNKFSYKNFSG